MIVAIDTPHRYPLSAVTAISPRIEGYYLWWISLTGN